MASAPGGWGAPGLAQVCCTGWHPRRGRLPCEAPAPGRPRCPVESDRPLGASQQPPAPPGTSCSSWGEGACPCPAPATPPPGGCLHSAPGEGEEGQAWAGLSAILNQCFPGQDPKGGLADVAALSHRHTPRHLGVGGRRKGGPGGRRGRAGSWRSWKLGGWPHTEQRVTTAAPSLVPHRPPD